MPRIPPVWRFPALSYSRRRCRDVSTLKAAVPKHRETRFDEGFRASRDGEGPTGFAPRL